ncbi:hypothetical protein Taro_037148, partial [Colocasia esculenta]|nr:hypothetical protein [Colocasia esculenta]
MGDPVAAMLALPQIYIHPSEMPSYRLYNGTGNPYLHVKEFLYESSRWQRDPITLAYLFRKSLDGPALKWFYSLEPSEAGDFRPLHGKFLQRELQMSLETPTEVNNPLIESCSIPPRRARPSTRWAKYVRKYLRVKMPIPKWKPKGREGKRPGDLHFLLFHSNHLLCFLAPSRGFSTFPPHGRHFIFIFFTIHFLAPGITPLFVILTLPSVPHVAQLLSMPHMAQLPPVPHVAQLLPVPHEAHLLPVPHVAYLHPVPH